MHMLELTLLLAPHEHRATVVGILELQQPATGQLLAHVAVGIKQGLSLRGLYHHDATTGHRQLPHLAGQLRVALKMNGTEHHARRDAKRLRDKLAVFLLQVNVLLHNLHLLTFNLISSFFSPIFRIFGRTF